MMECSSSGPENRADWRGFRYHINEIIETAEQVKKLLTQLDLLPTDQGEEIAETLTLLDVEILHHLQYHIEELKILFPPILKEIYERIGNGPEEPLISEER